MMKLVGFEQSNGEFNNKETGEVIEYDNTLLYFVTDEKEDVTGLAVTTAKAKTKDLILVGVKELKEALNKEVYPITDLTAKPDKDGKTKALIKKLVVA